MELGKGKTIRFRLLYVPEQDAKFVIEVQNDDGETSWRRLRSFTDRNRAQGFLDGYKLGLKHFERASQQIAVVDWQDEWPKDLER